MSVTPRGLESGAAASRSERWMQSRPSPWCEFVFNDGSGFVYLYSVGSFAFHRNL